MVKKRGFGASVLIGMLVGIICVTGITGCNDAEKSATGTKRKELVSYFGMKVEDTIDQFNKNGFRTEVSKDTSLEKEYTNIYVKKNGDITAVKLEGSEDNRVDRIDIYENTGNFSIFGIYAGLSGQETVDILKENGYVFDGISDSTTKNEETCQTIYYVKNGASKFIFEIWGGDIKPYGSLDEADIYMDGEIKNVSMWISSSVRYMELNDLIGDTEDDAEWLIEVINDECAPLSSFVEKKSAEAPEIDSYGTYTFGEDALIIELRKGIGYRAYIDKVSIKDLCPYKIFGIYYGMDKESALQQLSDLGIEISAEEENRIVCNVDSYTTLEFGFLNDHVNFIDCIDDYPEKHERKRIEE